jgi:acetylornithine/succinyldiaminopimelate/putrescine aminotransferase
MVFANLAEGYAASITDLATQLIESGVKFIIADPHLIRLVTHYWVDDAQIEKTIRAFKAIFAS